MTSHRHHETSTFVDYIRSIGFKPMLHYAFRLHWLFSPTQNTIETQIILPIFNFVFFFVGWVLYL